MKPSFKRDMDHNYMILESPGNAQGSEYQIRMLLLNQIPGFLTCNMRVMDGRFSFYYEITSRQPLSRIFEVSQMRKHDVSKLLNGIRRGMEGCKRYLLNADHLLLDPMYIYMEPETKEVFLCCLPFYEGEVTDGFRSLAEFILKHLDHSDAEAVMWGYEIYCEAAKQNYSLETILQSVYLHNGGQEKHKAKTETEESETSQAEEMLCKETENSTWTCKPAGRQIKRKWAFPVGAGALMILLGVICQAAGFDLTKTGGILFLAVALLAYFVEAAGKKRANKEERAAKRKTRNIPGRREESIQESYIQEEYGETKVLNEDSIQDGAVLISKEPKIAQDIVLKEDILLIGKLKGQANTIIPMPEISRIHARIEKREENYYLTDLNSKNGTFLNGIRMKANETAKLSNGNIVKFASVGFFFKE